MRREPSDASASAYSDEIAPITNKTLHRHHPPTPSLAHSSNRSTASSTELASSVPYSVRGGGGSPTLSPGRPTMAHESSSAYTANSGVMGLMSPISLPALSRRNERERERESGDGRGDHHPITGIGSDDLPLTASSPPPSPLPSQRNPLSPPRFGKQQQQRQHPRGSTVDQRSLHSQPNHHQQHHTNFHSPPSAAGALASHKMSLRYASGSSFQTDDFADDHQQQQRRALVDSGYGTHALGAYLDSPDVYRFPRPPGSAGSVDIRLGTEDPHSAHAHYGSISTTRSIRSSPQLYQNQAQVARSHSRQERGGLHHDYDSRSIGSRDSHPFSNRRPSIADSAISRKPSRDALQEAQRMVATMSTSSHASAPPPAPLQPVSVVSEETSTAEDSETCPICVESLNASYKLPGEKAHVIPDCGHALHEACFVAVYGPVPQSAVARSRPLGMCGVCRQPMILGDDDEMGGKRGKSSEFTKAVMGKLMLTTA